jgi:glyoxylase-like metal-dependent hydrolase (beta-lactamase superfamily II)
VLIDAGCGLDTLTAVRDQARPELVIASHSHVDHAAGCWLFSDSRLAVPLQAADTFGRLDRLSIRFAEPGALAAIWRDYVQRVTGIRDAVPTETYDDGHVFDLGPITLVAIHTPGHTVDHTCLWEPSHKLLLSFDIDLTGFGPWYGHPESDIASFKASIRRVMDLRPQIIISSHKGVLREALQEQLQRFLDAFDRRDERLLALLHQPRTLDDLVDAAPIYGSYPYEERILRHWERTMITKHLSGLLQDGRVNLHDGVYTLGA